MAQTVETNMEYQMFKGLQRPLEFMGLQGRYITWAPSPPVSAYWASCWFTLWLVSLSHWHLLQFP